MALEQEMPDTAIELRSAAESLMECPELAAVESATLEALAAAAVPFSLPAGATLFEAGSPSHAVYLLVSGRLGVRAGGGAAWTAVIPRGELVGEAGWLLHEPRGALVVAIRDSELLLLPDSALAAASNTSTTFALALARLCARRMRSGGSRPAARARGHVFVVLPNSRDLDALDLASRWVADLSLAGRAELVWGERASTHTAAWFNRIEECNDFVVYLADPGESAWTRQCMRQADLILLAAQAGARIEEWPTSIISAARSRGVRIDLALVHAGRILSGAAARWLQSMPDLTHHHLIDADDLARMSRLLTQRGVGLVLSGGGARGFAHLGIIRALREARIPIDFVGGVSIGAIIAGGAALGWSHEEMHERYRRSFVTTNPVNDYTFPWIALTRGRKVSRLLEHEYGEVAIEDMRRPFFCISANLRTGRAVEHRSGRLAEALRASVAIPGVMPPVIRGDDVLVDGAAINNLPVDVMQRHAPGFVIGSDVGADRRPGTPARINILQILMHAGMINGAATAAAQRALADVLLKPPLANIDLLNWQAFDRAIDAGYRFASDMLSQAPGIPRHLTQPT